MKFITTLLSNKTDTIIKLAQHKLYVVVNDIINGTYSAETVVCQTPQTGQCWNAETNHCNRKQGNDLLVVDTENNFIR